MATNGNLGRFNMETISVTLKFGFYQNRLDYPVSDPSASLIYRVYRDAERWVRELTSNLRNTPTTGHFRMNLYRISSTEFTMAPINRVSDIEQNSLIEIVLVPVEDNRNPHSLYRCQLNIPTNCDRCSRLITGIYKQGYRCRQCGLTFHKDCASLLVNDCVSQRGRAGPRRANPLMILIIDNPFDHDVTLETSAPGPPNTPTTRSGSGPTLMVIDKGIFPACLRGAFIYRRYAFFLTQESLIMTTNLSLIHAPQLPQQGEAESIFLLSTIQDIILTHFINDRDDIFEVQFQNRMVLSVGKKTDSEALQMETAQFYSYIRDQWESVINTTPASSPSPARSNPLEPLPLTTATATVTPKNPDNIEWRQPLQSRPSIYRLTPQDENSRDLFELYSLTGEKIGEGQFGKVVGAIRKSNGRNVAIKVIEKSNCDENEIQRINGEIQHLYRFNHMNILKLEAYFERDNAVYLITERMETDMCQYITTSPNGYVDEQTARMLVYQVIIALKYLHAENCGHLDVKCENILISLLKPISHENKSNRSTDEKETRDYPLVKLADFGYSKIIGEHSFRRTRVGTKIYNAPEIYRPKEGYNRQVDIWSVGIVLYATLSGTLPYTENEIHRAEELVRDRQHLFGDRPWDQVSEAAKNLIMNKLLVVRSASRVRANDALFDDWFTDFPLYQNLREIEKRAKHLIISRGQEFSSAPRWLTSAREDDVWSEYHRLYSQVVETHPS